MVGVRVAECWWRLGEVVWVLCVWLWVVWGGVGCVWLLSVEDLAVEAVFVFGEWPEGPSGSSGSGGGGLLLGLTVRGA